ncbi:GDSL esterase/lipase 5 [Senna tora]|uniref:GDSL esterase/lipase 5 n=1 Tax=Senna tora TaxID=362788 RepID=A0A835CHT5_9FABA|nr:GDSL esterase/lipase 5 [Senna tora]
MKARENGMTIMKMDASRIRSILLFSCASLFVSAFFYIKPFLLTPNHYSSSAALFVFGSSVFDPGNNNYINTTTSSQANFWPYGETFFRYPTGRFSDGRLIADFITEYAQLPSILPYLHPSYQSYIHGANFASGGSGALVETNKGLVIDLKTQLRNFRKVRETLRQRLGEDEAARLVSKAVYLFNIGSNDYTVYLLQNSSTYTPQEYVNMVIGNITDVIQEKVLYVKGIHKNGGRKFGFLGLWNLGCLPISRLILKHDGSCWEEASSLAILHNTQLYVLLQKLEKQLEGFKYSYTHSYDIFTEMTDNPSKYGFKEGKVACCGSGPYNGYYSCGGKRGIEEYELCENPDEHVFFDYGHLSDRANQFFANQMWNGDLIVTWPYNLRTLFKE